MPRLGKDMPLNRKRLRDIREKRELSQRQLSRRCGFGDTMIWRYENGDGDPSSDHLVKIARQLRVSSDYLLDLSDEELGHLSPGEKGLTEDEKTFLKFLDAVDLAGAVRMIMEK